MPETGDSIYKQEADDLMILERTEAEAFIHDYQLVLLTLRAHRDSASRQDFPAGLMDGRRNLAERPESIEVALEKLDAKGVHIDPCIEQAIRTLRLRECDGLLRTLARLRPNYRQSFNESYGAIRKTGRFQRRSETRLLE